MIVKFCIILLYLANINQNYHGYDFGQVYGEYSPPIFNGTGGAVLTILAYDDRPLSDYHLENDRRKTTVLWVTAKQESVPDRCFFEGLEIFPPFHLLALDPDEKII